MVVDFTVASVAFEMTRTIIESGAWPVMGTSGLTRAEVEELRQVASNHNVGGLIAPNFAIGAVLMMKFAKEAARYMPNVEIVEMHRLGKEEAPSGTALRTAELVAEGRQEQLPPRSERVTLAGSRGGAFQGVPIHAIRVPRLVARQMVVFGGTGQTLTLQHDSADRSSFMPGVVLACKRAPELTTLVYGFEEIL